MAKIFTDMELDDEKQAELAAPVLQPSDKPMLPRYPWGLRISFDDESLKKLKMDATCCAVGGIIHGHFMARITSVSSDQRENGESSQRVELQIEQLAVESEDDENEENESAEDGTRSRGRVLYDKG